MKRQTNRKGSVFASALALVASVFTLHAQNGIEPRYEKYNADRKSIEVDGDLSDWTGVRFIEPKFEATDGRETGKGNTTVGDKTYSSFAEFGGGTWSGPDDHTTSIAVAWDQDGLYLGIVVTDDEHEHAAGNAWNGDGVQMGLTNAARDTVTHLYNYAIRDGYESGKVYKSGDAGFGDRAIADKEKGPGNYTVAMVRDDEAKTTTYEALFTADSFGFTQFEVGQQFGFGVCVNDGDKDTPGQKGWSGWGTHMIVFGKTAPDAALVTLTAAEVLASFETDFSEGELPDTAELFGTATIGPDERDESEEPNEFLHVTDAVNSQNGSMKIGNITGDEPFKDFEVSFKVYISDSTCCGDGDDTSAGHRPADGWSLSIGNDLPDTIGLAEEGAGSGIRICFDTWDSGGGEAPAIDIWNGVEGQVGDGNQGEWSGGLFARQKFDGVTGASDSEKFKDPETGENVFMWTQGEWVDFKLKVYGGTLTIDYKGYQIISETLPAGWPALKQPQWLFAGRTGGANAAHWVDDFSVKVYKASGPIVSGFTGTSEGAEAVISDASGNSIDLESVTATFNGEAIEVSKSKEGSDTTVGFKLESPLAPGSANTLEITYADQKGVISSTPLSWTVANYTLIDPSSIADSSLKGESGFIAYSTQISTDQSGSGNVHGNARANAQKAFMGWGLDSFGEPYLNEADPEAFEGWSWYPVIVDVINHNQDAPGEAGKFNASNGFEDTEIPNIPGWNGSTDGIVVEYTALLELEKGAYTFGVERDDTFIASIGANFLDLTAQELGSGECCGNTEFDFYVQEAGLYPFRFMFMEGGGGAHVELYQKTAEGSFLVNGEGSSVKAYTISGVAVDESVTETVDTGRASVVSINPANGDALVKSKSINLHAKNGSKTSIEESSIVMKLNGNVVEPNISKNGDDISISLAPEAGLPVGTHTVEVTMNESNGKAKSVSWSFTVPGVYAQVGNAPSEAQGFVSIREYHGIGGTALSAAYADADFPDNPDVNTIATYLEWPQSGDINVNPPGNVRDNYAWTAMGYIHPPETGEYRFFVATDDNSQMWLSTDEDPANAVQITQESQWRGVRSYGDEDESNSDPIFLEAGKAYFFEVITNEGGGGDNMAVAWSLPSDEGTAPENGSNPISGEYLSPYISTIDPEPTPMVTGHSPSGAVPNDQDDKVELTLFNRGLEIVDVAVTVNGSAVDSKVTVDGKTSTISADIGSVNGAVEISVSYNGLTEEWSYLAFEPLVEGGANPIMYYDFDYAKNPEKTWDHVFGTEGKVNNAVFTDDTPTGSGNAMDMTSSSNGNVFVANAAALNIASSINEVSVSFWQKNVETGNSHSFWADPGRAMSNHVPWSNGNIYWDTAGCCGGDTQRINADATDTVTFTDWNHYVFIKSGDTKEIWVNGELFHDGVNTNPLPSNIQTLYIGAGANGGGSLNGIIDEFVVFASTLDEDQIMAIYEGNSDIIPAKIDISKLDVDATAEMVDVTSADNVVVPTSTNSPDGEQAANAIDNDSSTKYLNFDGKNNTPSGLTISTGSSIVSGMALTSANDAPERDPASYIIWGSNDGENFTEISQGDVPAFSSRFERVALTFENNVSYSDYRIHFPTTASSNGCCMQIAEIELLSKFSDLADISSPGDEVVALITEDSPNGERVIFAIDDNDQTKYLNFTGKNNNPSGLSIATAGGIVKGVALTSANDAPERDPATYTLSGSNDGKTWEEIASGDVPSFSSRFERQAWAIDNEKSYSNYELIFNTTASSNGCCMQVAEVELLGVSAPASTVQPSIKVVRNVDGSLTVEFEGTLQTAPTVNGPWSDVDAASPVTWETDQEAGFARSKK